MKIAAAHRFHLDGKRRHVCPSCGKRGTFSRYVDEAGEVDFPDRVGICSRANNCGYRVTLKDFLAENPDFLKPERAENWRASDAWCRPMLEPKTPPSMIDPAVFERSMTAFETNNLGRYLAEKIGIDAAKFLFKKYNVGTSSRWGERGGATVFWQVDERGGIRSGKIILYDPTTGRRQKGFQNWAHSVLNLPDFNLQQCFFGEHLLRSQPQKAVAVVESEKTALVCSIFFHALNFVWLASGGLNMVNAERCEILRGRRIVFFPDTATGERGRTPFELWSEKAAELRNVGHVVEVNDFLERRADEYEKRQGVDLADFVLRFDLQKQAERVTQSDDNKICVTLRHAHKSLIINELCENESKQSDESDESDDATKRSYSTTLPTVELNAAGYPAFWD